MAVERSDGRDARFGRYDVVAHLASGGMAEVFLARASGDGGFSRHLVIKAMRPSPGLDGTFARMFLDEARLAATLHHQHIAQVFDLGTADDGSYYLVMEYVHGETLRSVVATARARGLTLPAGFAVAVGAAMANALQYAHERCDERGRPLGIVHRDVTPANILVGHDGAVKLIDFGIAKAAARTSQTQTGVVKGKAGYMAPEQVLTQPLDARTDVFALGIVLYELTTLERLFAGASDFEAAQRCVDCVVPRPSDVRPGFPPALEAVLLTALAREPGQRFPSARAMGQALVDAAARDGLDAHPSIVERVVGKLFGPRPEPWQRADTDVDDDEGDDDETLPAVGWMKALPLRPLPLSATASAGSPASLAAAAEPTLVAPVMMPVLSLPLPAPAEEPVRESEWTDESAPEAFELPPRPGTVPRRAITHPPAMRGRRRAMWGVATVAALVTAAVAIAASIAWEEPELEAPVAIATVSRASAAAVVPRASTPAPAAVPETPPPSPPATPPPIAPDDGTVRLTITTTPPDATVVVDGRRLGRTPFTGTFTPRGKQVSLKVRKRGHRPRRAKLPVEPTLTWDVRLPKR